MQRKPIPFPIRILLALAGLLAVGAVAADVTVTPIRPMSFGSFVAGAGGTVTVSPSGARTASGGVYLIPSSQGAAAEFELRSDVDGTYSILLPEDDVSSLGDGSTIMRLRAFTSQPANFVTLGAGISQRLTIGATLQVGAVQPTGDYTGSFDVIIEYQ